MLHPRLAADRGVAPQTGCGGNNDVTAPLLGRVPASRVLLVASFGAFLAFLDATIVNVAFPSIRESFPGTSIARLSWVLNAYNIVFAAFLIVFGLGALTVTGERQLAVAVGVATTVLLYFKAELEGFSQKLTAQDLREIEDAASRIPVEGARGTGHETHA